MRKFTVKSHDTDLLLCEYLPDGEPIAAVQIAHGMEEHQGRYRELAEYLSARGFVVVTADMRGHGELCDESERGFFAEREGWRLLLDDQLAVHEEIARLFPDKPIYLIAHSMGSIITRVLLKTESRRWERVILTGYPAYNSAAPLGVALCDMIGAVKGSHGKSALLKRMTRTVFNRGIENPTSEYDWISLDTENVQSFCDDQLCGFGFTVSGFRDLFVLVEKMHETDGCERVNASLPILLLSGQCDPCTSGTRGRLDSYETLKKQGFSHIEVLTFPDMRHEILHENQRVRVFDEIARFIK